MIDVMGPDVLDNNYAATGDFCGKSVRNSAVFVRLKKWLKIVRPKFGAQDIPL